ncbi:MAG: transaldolase family protein [Sphaerochaetaceae bacterium]
MHNAWREIQKLSDQTEIWWDSSPVVWPNFKEDMKKYPGLTESEKKWLDAELDGMFFDAPVNNWVYRGCTTNPPLSWDVLKIRKAEWAEIIKEVRKNYKGSSKYGLFRMVYQEVVRQGAEKFMPLFEASNGKYGHISAQVDPLLMNNEAAMREMAEELAVIAPNIMIKIPGSTAGIPIFKHLASKGIATNATAIFNLSQIMRVAENVAEGRKIHLAENKTPRHGWRAVCTHMNGRLEDSKAFRGVINSQNLNINAFELRVASEVVVKKAAELFVERDLPIKILTCSARKHKNQNGEVVYPHIDMFVGGPLVYTVPGTVIGDVLVHYRNRDIVAQWDNAPDAATVEKLRQVDYFNKSIDEHGFAVEQFDEITSMEENMDSFQGAFREMINYVGTFV